MITSERQVELVLLRRNFLRQLHATTNKSKSITNGREDASLTELQKIWNILHYELFRKQDTRGSFNIWDTYGATKTSHSFWILNTSNNAELLVAVFHITAVCYVVTCE